MLLLLRSIALAAVFIGIVIPAAVTLAGSAAAAVGDRRLAGPCLSLLLLHAGCGCCNRSLQVGQHG
jgi:hypothetical protein